MPSRFDMHGYQERAVDFIIDKRRVLLALEMGLGKTVSTLTAVSDLLGGAAIRKVLVIAPLRVANSVWAQESAKWEHLRHLTVTVVTGSEKQRMAALHQDVDVYVINRENVVWLVEHTRRWRWDCVVVDESSSFKDPSSKRFKSLKKALPDTTHMILLTGTPTPNSLLDLWAQVFLIDFGQALGRSISAYKTRFFTPDYMGYKFTLQPGAQEKIQDLVAQRVLSMSAADYIELPDRIDLMHPVALPDKTLRLYQRFERELFAELDSGVELEAMSAAVLAGKLLQWCNGAVYVDDIGGWQLVHDEKMDALAEIVEANEGENLLVAYNFKSDLARLRERFPDAVVLDADPQTIERWNRGEIRMLLAHPQSAGHGLNLQHGGAVIVWFGLVWSLEYYQQFNARLHRQGQGRPVRIMHLVAQGCLDERVMRVLAGKAKTQQDLIDALKAT